MAQDNFVKDLMEHIINGVRIPKVQVERAINPILSLFVESVLNSCFHLNQDSEDSYKLISPEFPLKKVNNQSTNIDYLLSNSYQKSLVLFELKTDVSSIDVDQINRYVEYKNVIQRYSANMLRRDLFQISDASSKSNKYNYICSRFDEMIKNPSEIHNVIIVYLVPNALKEKIKAYPEIDFVFSYSNLPVEINHKYNDQWKIIRNALIELDHFFMPVYINKGSSNPSDVIVRNIKNYVTRHNNKCMPESFQIGILGGGLKPNYQVNFTDGSKKTFRFNGSPHSVEIFKDSNLSKKYLWNEVENQ